jgi:malate dehydrogenase (oxaloacetate-decarboxylating)(NADP+)
MLFAEGDEPNVLRAAIAFKEGGYGTPILIGRENVHEMLRELGVEKPEEYEVLNSRNSPLVGRAVDFLYAKRQRCGMLRREVERMVNQDRNTSPRRCSPWRGRRHDHRHDAALQPIAEPCGW